MLQLEPAADSPRALVANLGHAADGAIGLPGALAWSTVLDHAAFTARPCLLWLALAVECSCGRDAERVHRAPNAFSGITKLPPPPYLAAYGVLYCILTQGTPLGTV